MIQDIQTKQQKQKFTHNGYLYVFDKHSKRDVSIKFWRCEKKNECKARLHTRNDRVVKELNEHSHGASAALVEVALVQTLLKKRAIETQEQPSAIVNACSENVSQAAQASFPRVESMKQIIRRKRNIMNIAPPNPINARELVIPDEYKSYVNANGESEDFLIADSGTSDDRILIFGRQSWIVFLRDSDVWYCDGTFKLSPLIFKHVNVLMAKRYGSVHPVLYCLLPNKSRNTYQRMFQMIRNATPGVNPRNISSDFEQAAISAMRDCFPDVQINGCFFHLSHNIHKQLKQCGLQSAYSNNPEFALKAKMITALSFVPIPSLGAYIDALADDLPDGLHPLLDWFEDNYVGRPLRRGNERRPPLFPPEMWNQYNRTVTGMDRTNNHAEAAHRKIYAELGVHHPVIWRFISCLKKIQRSRDTYYEHLVAGHPARHKLLKYIRADERILRIVQQFDERDPLEYLRGLAHNYDFH